MQVRPYRAQDAEALAELFHAAIHGIARRHYSDEQVRAWAPRVPDAAVYQTRASDGRLLLVAAGEDDQPLAYGDLEADGHIDHLFCHPDAAGTGVTALLYERIERAAAERGIGLLYVEASEPARRFFLKMGFTIVKRREFLVTGIPIHNFRMEKRLQS
jgi:putative acetyltransferase